MDRRVLLSLIAGTAALPQLVRAIPLQPQHLQTPPPQQRVQSSEPQPLEPESPEPEPPEPEPLDPEPQPEQHGFRLNLTNQHTGETFNGIYRDDLGPISRVMDELSVFLRDFHSGEQIGIDVRVIDFLAQIMQVTGQQSATILSAYRTPQTNRRLCKAGFAAAENSQHLYGRALDVRFDDNLDDAMNAARTMQRGGVGWYPHSSFIHIDTGPVRNWDLDRANIGTLLVGRHRMRFDKRGNLLVERHRGRGGRVAAGASKAPQGVRARLKRLHQVARDEYLVRRRGL